MAVDKEVAENGLRVLREVGFRDEHAGAILNYIARRSPETISALGKGYFKPEELEKLSDFYSNGLEGARVAFAVAGFILNVGNRQDYSPKQIEELVGFAGETAGLIELNFLADYIAQGAKLAALEREVRLNRGAVTELSGVKKQLSGALLREQELRRALEDAGEKLQVSEGARRSQLTSLRAYERSGGKRPVRRMPFGSMRRVIPA